MIDGAYYLIECGCKGQRKSFLFNGIGSINDYSKKQFHLRPNELEDPCFVPNPNQGRNSESNESYHPLKVRVIENDYIRQDQTDYSIYDGDLDTLQYYEIGQDDPIPFKEKFPDHLIYVPKV